MKPAVISTTGLTSTRNITQEKVPDEIRRRLLSTIWLDENRITADCFT